jgi:glycosidase
MSATQQPAIPSAISKKKVLPALRKHPQLYEINLWPWLDRLSLETKQQVTIGSIPDSELDKLQALGFDLVYMMGMWTRSRVGRTLSRSLPHLFPDYEAALPGWRMQDVVGSPFSIQAYEPDPHVGTWTELAALRDSLHDRGMRLILDFVPNHTGPDHAWVRENPEFYIQGTLEDFKRAPQDFYLSELDDGKVNFIACGRDPNFAPWRDTAQLNYFNPRQRRAMLSELATISQFCDGVRCDMAMLLLNDTFAQTWQRQLQNWPKPQREFWQEAIESLPGFIWMAEAYSNTEWKLQQLGFQFTYDKCFYDRLRDNAVHELRLHLMADYNYQCGSVRFLENHDEPRSQSAFADRLPAVAVLMGTVPGMHFYHEGQLDGRKRRIPVQLARAAEEPRDERVRATYEKILHISNDSVFHEGVWTQLDPQNTGDGSQVNMVAYAWHSAKQCWLIVVNLSSGTSTARIFLPDEMIGSSRQLRLRDELKEQTYLREAAEIRQKGLFVLLGGYGAHMFGVTRV